MPTIRFELKVRNINKKSNYISSYLVSPNATLADEKWPKKVAMDVMNNDQR